MLDVVVTCLPHGPEIASFPQVRGYYLAKHLARSGLRAEFRPLPLPSLKCNVVICSEYQSPVDYFERELAPPLLEIDTQRLYCMIAYSLRQEPTHFSREHCEWFAARGGVLCHLPSAEFEPYEHWVGLGVDRDVVQAGDGARNRILFDFPRSADQDASATFDFRMLEVVRARLRDCVIVGSGPADSPIRDAFDEWIDYGQTHAAFTQAALRGIFAFVPGWEESMGLQVAEAQVVGACIVSSTSQVPPSMLCPEANVPYVAGDAESLAGALVETRTRDSARISAEAAARFDFFAMAKRTRKAIGL